MILIIDTTKDHDIEVEIKKDNKTIAQKIITAQYSQAEKLLPLIDKVLKGKKLSLKDIKEVHVNNSGGSFTALRIGVVTANALGYALGVPVQPNAECRMKNVELRKEKIYVVEPIYGGEPNITVSSKKHVII